MARHPKLALAAAVLVAATAIACSKGGGPGSPTAPSGSGSVGALDATFTNVRSQILTPRCTGCHFAGLQASSGNLNLEPGAAYGNLVNVPAVGSPSVMRVLPGNADASYIIQKVEGRAGIVGNRMPDGGPYLTSEQVDLIRRWIQAGAPNN